MYVCVREKERENIIFRNKVGAYSANNFLNEFLDMKINSLKVGRGQGGGAIPPPNFKCWSRKLNNFKQFCRRET